MPRKHCYVFVILVILSVATAKTNTKQIAKSQKQNGYNAIKNSTPANTNITLSNNIRTIVSQQVKSRKVSCGRDNINEMSRSVRCKPRSIVVELISEHKYRFVPNAVLAKRCTGSCDGFQRCLATKSTNTTYFVKELIKNKTFCSAVEVLEDLECACDCEVEAKDCTPYQRYSPNTCSCKCNDNVEYRKCKNLSNKSFAWNDRKCSCECIGTQSCSSGLIWDPVKCRCAKSLSKNNPK